MEILLTILSIFLAIVGIAGGIIPGLPGPPISFFALVLIGITEKYSFSETFYIISALLAFVITLLDYYVPIYGTKKFGGTKAGVRGSTIGLIVSVLLLPLLGIVIGPFGLVGILLGPFAGAYLGETIAGTSGDRALRAAFGSFIGFLAGTLMKLTYSIAMLVIIFATLLRPLFS